MRPEPCLTGSETASRETLSHRAEDEDKYSRLLLSLCVWPAFRHKVDHRCGELCADEWRRALGLARIHALTPILYAAAVEGWLGQPVPDMDALRRIYFVQGARAALALEELREVAEALSQTGVNMVALKGIASILSVYPDQALRALSDLDILIGLADLNKAVSALSALGYSKIDKATSAEDEWLTVMYLDGICLSRPRRLPIEVHCSFLGGLGDASKAVEDAWRNPVSLEAGAWSVLGLRPEHAFITAACHLHRNYSRALPYMKDVADLALLTKRIELQGSWERMWESARRWRVMDQVRGVAAFLNAYTPAHVPDCEDAKPAFSPTDLVYALERLEGRGRLSEGLAARMHLIGRLPSARARIRFLMGLVVPRAGFLRWRYRLGNDRAVAPYYALHIFRALVRTTEDIVLRARQGRRRRSV